MSIHVRCSIYISWKYANIATLILSRFIHYQKDSQNLYDKIDAIDNPSQKLYSLWESIMNPSVSRITV